MYCKFCTTEVKPIDTFLTEAYCTECGEVIGNKDMQETKTVNQEPENDK